jgi:hypothetical protein
VLSGVAALFQTAQLSTAGAYSLTGKAAPLGSFLAGVSGSYILTGYAANEPMVGTAAGGAYAIAPVPTPLIRTGADFDLVYGGVGHYLEEIERLRQLAKITRKTPAPIVRPSRPLQNPTAAPSQAIQLAAIAPQRATDQQTQQARILKRRRQEAELLLLVS